MTGQSLDAKRAETRRPLFGQRLFDDGALGAWHIENVRKTLADFGALRAQGVTFSPFLEIGAGHVQRSLALANDFGADGVATDISQDALRDTPFMLKLLHYHRAPLLLCCDALHLPFLPDTFQFVFAYQTLHHFENPVPIVQECCRVLGKGGYFYCDEEPMDSLARRWLRGKRTLSHPPTRVQRVGQRLRIEKLFWDDGASERRSGITEMRFDLPIWRETLQCFDLVRVEVNRLARISIDLRRDTARTRLAGVVGGNVKALGTKRDGEAATADPCTRLMCLDCAQAVFEHQPDWLRCQHCGRRYPYRDDVLRMLPRELEQQLYSHLI